MAKDMIKRILMIGVILALLIAAISCGKSEPETTPTSDTTPPSITNVTVSNITETSATITWTTDEPATSQVEYGKTIEYGLSTPLDESLITSHSVSLSGLEPNTTYHYRVKSKDEAGNEATSEDNIFTASAALPDTTPPVITNVTASDITKTSANITWTTDELATSQVEYGETNAYGSATPLDENLVTGHSVSLSGLEPNTTYHFRIESKDEAGNGATSEDKIFTTLALPDTTPPVISAVSVSNTTEATAAITWTTDELATSQVEYGETTDYGSSTTLDESLITSHSVTLTNLAPNTTYHFRVRSSDPYSNIALSSDNILRTSKPSIEVSGFISTSTRWETSYDYIVTGDVRLSHGATLTIDPGVTVKFASRCGLRIDGILQAVGTEDNPITFTSALNPPSAGDWGPIYLSYSSDLVHSSGYIKYAVIEYGGWGGVVIAESGCGIEYTTFTNNGKPVSNISPPDSVVKFQMSAVFRNNILSANRARAMILVEGADMVNIEQNVISNNEGAAICVQYSESITVSQNRIEGNSGGSGSQYATGITFTSSDGVIQSNQIINNCNDGIDGNAAFAAMYVTGENSVQVLSNVVRGNSYIHWGEAQCGIIYVWTRLGGIFSHNTVTENNIDTNGYADTMAAIICVPGSGNKLTDNNFNNNYDAPYVICIVGGSPYNTVDATNNYWGTDDESLIDSWIYDFYDDFNLSKLVYQPIAIAPIMEAS